MIHHTASLLDDEEEEDEEEPPVIVAAVRPMPTTTSQSTTVASDTNQPRRDTGSTTIPTTRMLPPEANCLTTDDSVQQQLPHLQQQLQQLQQQQQHHDSLRHRCDEIRAARRHCARQRQSCRELESQLNDAAAQVQRQHDQTLVRYAAVLSHQQSLTRLLRRQQQWNVLQADAFRIDCHVPQSATCGTLTNTNVNTNTTNINVNTNTTAININVNVNINTVATINGLRLGNYTAVKAGGAAGVGSVGPLESPPQSQPPHSVIPHRFFPFVSSPNPANTTTVPSPFPSSVDGPPTNNNINNTPVFHTNTTIPWREINAALGQVALVLSILEQQILVTTATSNSTASTVSTTGTNASTPMLRYELLCRGSTSRIGLRKTPPSTNAYFNLYFTPTSNADASTPRGGSGGSASSWASYFITGPSDRNFNVALTMLLDCVAELATVLCARDPTIQIPYTMVVRQGTIGGLPIVRFPTPSTTTPTATKPLPNPAETWTRAMKYLLTNLKHMMAFRGLGLFATPVSV